MEFDFCIPKDARLLAHISQRSNLKYVKIVMDHFNDRQREDFCNSPFRYLAEIPEIQFSAQLIQQLVFKTIHTDKVWAYEAVPEIGERFGRRVGERMPRLLSWSARKQPQHRTYDAFFKNVQLHVYTTLRPTDAEAEQQYFSTLVPYDDPPVPVLDDIVRTIVEPQFNTSHVGSRSGGQLVRQDSDDKVSSGGSAEDETFGDDDGDRQSGNDRDGDDTEDSGKGASERSSDGEDTRRG
ncbi:Hypothetical predicted protein [Olea europaea subsp. europaea]|uniref:Uncharacterized protein n=1 Tax=Olea europaea subsp. europaea TaxID=158383 RepID=A0A8S0VGY9_OLEEU|nr:Hypothetical predicted protein [Olea europaea subsp. europaea]